MHQKLSRCYFLKKCVVEWLVLDAVFKMTCLSGLLCVLLSAGGPAHQVLH